MEARRRAMCEARAQIFKAMGHPTRIFLVDELTKGERCVCELTELVGADMSTVSKHLSILRNAGIVEDEKRGLMVFYRLRIPCIKSLFQCIESVLEQKAQDQLALMGGERA